MKTVSKTIIVTIAFFLITTPIISANYIKKSNIDDKGKYLEKTSAIDTKIMAVIESINETLLRSLLEDLVSFGPRMTGTYGCEKAGEYIYDKFKEMELATRYHYWESIGNKYHPRFFKDRSVEATLEGIDNPEKDILIFNAHYDSVKVSPGANDDGSGTVAVLAAAYALSKFEFNRTIKFVTFSGEEVGLLGSNAYAKEIYENSIDLLAELNADMIGYAVSAEGGKTYRLSGTEDTEWMLDAIEMINEDYSIGFTQLPRGGFNRAAKSGGSDYFGFLKHGYECLAFWQSEFDSAYFHTPEDTIEHVNFSYLVNTTRLIAGALAYLADVEIEHPQIEIVSPERGKLYFEDRIIRNYKDFKTVVLDDVLICAEVEPGTAPIQKVEFYYDGKIAYVDMDEPYQLRLNKFSIMKHSVTAKVIDENDNSAEDTLYFTYFNLIKRK